MLVLREMYQDEYPAYCQYFIDDYSREIAKNYGHSMEHAIELAKKDLKRCFPNGLESEQHSLLCIDVKNESTQHLVGYLWHCVNEQENSTFIYDFYVSEQYRGLGYGSSALTALEEQLVEIGINQIKLRVAYHNERALKLYQEVGFMITGFNMSKKLTSD